MATENAAHLCAEVPHNDTAIMNLRDSQAMECAIVDFSGRCVAFGGRKDRKRRSPAAIVGLRSGRAA
jgi:hypothetical protein